MTAQLHHAQKPEIAPRLPLRERAHRIIPADIKAFRGIQVRPSVLSRQREMKENAGRKALNVVQLFAYFPYSMVSKTNLLITSLRI